MKTLILGLLLIPGAAQAYIECAGETYKGDIVKVAISTVGTMGAIQEGRVEIELKNGAKSGYTILRDEIPQFYEGVEGSNHEKGLVFLSAYVDANYPVSIRYVGTNFERDLVEVLRTPGRKKEPNNEMRVWKGPGFAGVQQFQFTDVVCAVSMDP